MEEDQDMLYDGTKAWNSHIKNGSLARMLRDQDILCGLIIMALVDTIAEAR